MGLTVHVYRNGNYSDSTNDGISKYYDRILLANVEGPDYPDESELPTAYLVEGNLSGTIKIIPAIKPEGSSGPMMGGNYASSCDRRFGEACEEITGNRFYGAVAIHDRFED